MIENNQNKKQAKLQLNIDNLDLKYASQFNLQATSEEVFIDLASCSFPGSNQNEIIIPIHSRIIMNYFNTKRLMLALKSTVDNYEKNYGTIELNPIKKTEDTKASFPKAIITKRKEN